jgi:LacI family transcriptional regulator
MKKVSLQDIATHLNVSKSLVSFVLNGKGNERGIHPDTQRRVLEKARELNYKPHFIARGLRMGRSHTIGLIVADISNNFYATIARRVEEVAGQNNYRLIFGSSDEDPLKEIALIEMLRERQVDGLIISTTQNKTAVFTRMRKEKFPFVLIDRQLPMLKTNYVGVENHHGAYRATRQLIRNGYRKIALMKISPAYLSPVKERERGYRDAMKDAGIRIRSNWVQEIDFKHLRNQVNQSLKQLLSPEQDIEALFTINNRIAVACLECLQEMQVSIPEDLAMISFDDIDLFRLSNPKVTAIAQPLNEIGEEAVNILLKEIAGNQHALPARKVLPVDLVVRGSCGGMAPFEEVIPQKALHHADYENGY